MPTREGVRARRLADILYYATKDGINVKEDIPYISQDLKLSQRKIYSLILLLTEIGMLEPNENRTVYTLKKEKGIPPFEEYTKAERFLKGYYRATGELEDKVDTAPEPKLLTK